MELTNAILAGEHRCGKRVSLRPSDGTTLMNSAWANLQGLNIAIVGCGGVQRSIGGVSAIAFHGVGVRLGRPGRTIEAPSQVSRFSRRRMTKAHCGLGKCYLIR